jgi:hypothetical protein
MKRLIALGLAVLFAFGPIAAEAQPPKPAYVSGSVTAGHCSTWSGPQSLQDASCPAAANPTATASDTAVNGSATTYMRSDGAPPVQKATNAQFGIVEGDGTTLTCSTGVCSAIAAFALVPSAEVVTTESTASTSYTDLATSGPAVTLTTGTSVAVLISGRAAVSGGGIAVAAPAVSGATTLAASDSHNGAASSSSNTFLATFTALRVITGLTAGSNTFTLKYRVTAGTGFFEARDIAVFRLN